MYDVRLKLNRLEKEITEVSRYEEEEIQEGLIMFYGDSAFTRWNKRWNFRPMTEDIRRKDGSLAVVNHGFGTSTAEELLYYYNRLVKPWKPRALVVNVYSNDRDVAYTPGEIMALLSRLFAWARTDMPGIKIYACKDRPILLEKDKKGTWYYHQKEFNELIEQYCAKHDDCTLIDYIQSPLFFHNPKDVGDYSKIRTDIYVEDKVHFNQLGYDLYRDFFLEVLDDIL